MRDLPLAPGHVSGWPELGEGRGSAAVGSITHGRLLREARLPPYGPHLRATSNQLRRGTWAATDEMIWVLERAGAHLARAREGAVLAVANISKRGGGAIPWSISHQNGRDADLLFPLMGPDGSPFPSEAMLHLAPDGSALSSGGTPLRLDVAGLLAVVTGLLDQERVPVEYIFLSRPIRDALLREAEAAALPRGLIRKMEGVVRQPRGALPHDDHLHVRIGCTLEDVDDGCRDRRPSSKARARAQARLAEVLPLALRGPGARRAQAIELLRWLSPRDPEALRAFLAGLASRSAKVRRASLRALVGRAGDRVDRALASHLSGHRGMDEVAALLLVVEARPDRRWTRTLRALLRDRRPLPAPRRPAPARTPRGQAIWLAGMTGDPRMAPALLDVLAEGDARPAAALALRRLTLMRPADPEDGRAWRALLPRRPAQLQAEVRRRLMDLGLLDPRGRVQREACLDTLRRGEDAELQAARRLLDNAHRRPCRCLRWSREDLVGYWQRRLR